MSVGDSLYHAAQDRITELEAELDRFRNGFKGGCYACETVGEKNIELELRVAELQHWMHGYSTPEESMAAMAEQSDGLEGVLENMRGISMHWNERGCLLTTTGKTFRHDFKIRKPTYQEAIRTLLEEINV